MLSPTGQFLKSTRPPPQMDKDMRQLQKNLDVETFGVTGERAGYGYGHAIPRPRLHWPKR